MANERRSFGEKHARLRSHDATGEIDNSITPHVIAIQVFSLYYASVVSWLGGSMPVLENQLALPQRAPAPAPRNRSTLRVTTAARTASQKEVSC